MMSDSWAGFTDEDIEQLRLNPKTSKSCPERACEIDDSKSNFRKPMKIKNPAANLNLKKSSNISNSSACLDEKITKDLSTNGELHASDGNSSSNLGINHEDATNSICNCHVENGNGTTGFAQTPPERVERTSGDASENTNLCPLDIFEMRQKRIEAENARRRALINKAINDKKMQTHVEAVKLAKITQELNQIDSDFSADVAILRDYIEKASQEFSDAEKHYLRAEKEYVEAKLELFKKLQKKEMLTEHLCAIIEQNENRKADKLVELMKQLEMEVVTDHFSLNGIEPILPNLCMLNEEQYHTCTTIKPCLNNTQSKEDKTQPVISHENQEKIPEFADSSSSTTDEKHEGLK